MYGISRSRELDKEIPHGVLPMEQLVMIDKWARKEVCLKWYKILSSREKKAFEPRHF